MSRTAALLLLLLAAPAAAQEGGASRVAIADARTMLRSFEYERAIERLGDVLRSTTAAPAERITAQELRAVFLLLLNRQAEARTAAEQMLQLDPGHRPSDPSYSPTIMTFFERVQREFEPTPSVELTVDVPAEVRSAERAEVEVALAGGEGVEQVFAYMRRERDDTFRRMPLERRSPTRFAGVLPRYHGGEAGSVVELYFEAHAPSGYGLGREGSEDDPLRVRVLSSGAMGVAVSTTPALPSGAASAGGEDPWYTHWALWAVVGVLVAGGVITGIAVAATQGGGFRMGNLGTAQLAP